MEHYGWLSLLPPILTVVLALVTKEVIFSLFTGIFIGYFIVNSWNPLTALVGVTDGIANSLNDGWNIRIILFCAMLGAFVGLMQATGAANAFGKWMASKVKTRVGTLIVTWVFGLFIFIDDYFNSLTIGTVMRPVTDEQKISRAKLAYILDSTAAPVSVLAPISSWVVTIMSLVKGSDGFEKLGVSEFTFFIMLIPINLYAILAILMVLQTTLRKDFGPMAASESRAMKGLGLYDEKYGQPTGEVEGGPVTNKNAKAVDMILPILVLVGLAVVFFPVTTYLGAIDGENVTTFSQAVSTMTLGEAFNNTDASKSLFYASIFTLVFSSLYFMFRKLLNIKQVGAALTAGIKSMVPALIILTLAWTIGGIIKTPASEGGLGLSIFLSEVVTSGGFPLWLLPLVVFLIAALISFATGTSWGTFSIMIPITMPIAIALAEKTGANLMNSALVSIGAAVGGAIFGDHCSPISDTTILSSTGASCPHLEHVATQIPYAVFCMVIAGIGYIIAGLFDNPYAGLVSALVVFFIAYEIMIRITKPEKESSNKM
ncbi:MAG TPA: Na+/H+ antiporter NhaC family protein [Fervidobacterium sp.]|nr:Na+/H+ antiporter NhaC family protein [Fervidobacterium sp.]HRD19900.1 Na+/H+ antiporter NhaC family protein [Fervidobacterium sp.]